MDAFRPSQWLKENLDLDWPAEMDAETKKSDPSMHESYATNAETKQDLT